MQALAVGTYCSLAESRNGVVEFCFNGKVSAMKEALDFLEKVRCWFELFFLCDVLICQEITENYRLVTTKFNEFLPIMSIYKEDLPVIEKLFDVRVNIEKTVIQPAERKKKGLTCSQSGFEFWRKVVPPPEAATNPAKPKGASCLVLFILHPCSCCSCQNFPNFSLLLWLQAQCRQRRTKPARTFGETVWFHFYHLAFTFSYHKASVEMTDCQARGVKNQRKKLAEEFKVDMQFKYPAWNQEKYVELHLIWMMLWIRAYDSEFALSVLGKRNWWPSSLRRSTKSWTITWAFRCNSKTTSQNNLWLVRKVCQVPFCGLLAHD